MPITEDDKKCSEYVKEISCYQKGTEKQKARFAEREKPLQLAAQKGFSHVLAIRQKNLQN